MKTYKIKATVVTPLSIGDGSQYSPYKDYFIENGMVHYIDQRKLGELLTKDDRLMDEYVEGVANMEGNRSRFDIKSFINDRLRCDVSSVVKSSIIYDGLHIANKLPIHGICKTPKGHPYLPGSSVKGALKTAALYNFLEKDVAGEELSKKILEEPYKKEITKELEDKLTQFEFSVSDSSLLNLSDMSCIHEERIHIKKGTFIIPTHREVLNENANATLTIQFNKKNQLTWFNLVEYINKFAMSGLLTERGILMDADNKSMKDKDYNALDDFYIRMNNVIEKAQQNVAYLRLGFGKGFYMNSIASSIFEKDETEEKLNFKNYLKAKGYGKAYNPRIEKMQDYELDPYVFPITRNIKRRGVEPLGWVKLEKMD